MGGAGGIIGTNQLAEASPDGETFGFSTLNVLADALGDPALRTSYSDFVMIAGIESPLVVYIRKDAPPGIKDASGPDEGEGVQGAVARRAQQQHDQSASRA